MGTKFAPVYATHVLQGLEAIDCLINKYPDELPNSISKELIINSIKLILENNSFCFSDIYFLSLCNTCCGRA